MTTPPSQLPSQLPSHTPSQSSPPPGTILVVDDQPANIQVVGAALGKLGHEIIPASDGATALRRLASRIPDLILLDLLMPEMDGCEVCRQLKANPDWRDIPVIFLSAADDKDLIVRALESGGVDYITKPFHRAELVSRVRTQLALKWTGDRLKQLAEDKDELLGILTHDLKNHLGGMQMSAQLLRSRVERHDQPDPKTTQLAENIERTSSQLLGFVKEFLANTAADHGFQLAPTHLDLTRVAQETINQYQESARRKQQVIHAHLPPHETPVLADPSALEQILDNLLSNALKFSPPGSAIHLSVHPGDSIVEFKLRDEGPGFSNEDQKRMFRRYARLSARPTAGEPSTGLGLSIVKKLVLAMKGKIECLTQPGQGTTFVIQLPTPSRTSQELNPRHNP